MGMLLRHRPEPDTLTTTECFGRPEKEEKKQSEKKQSEKKEQSKKKKKKDKSSDDTPFWDTWY